LLSTSTTGVSIGPEAAACVGAAEVLSNEGWIAPDDRVVLFNCGAAQKYPQTLDLDLPHLAPDASIDWDRLAA
jgi:threonine synthase